MIGHCAHGPQRRQWLRTLGWQVRPTVRRIWRRLGCALAFLFKWAFVGALMAAGAVLMLALMAESFRHDPLTTTPTAKPVSAPAAKVVRRMT